MLKPFQIRPAFYDDEESVVAIMNTAIQAETNAYLTEFDWVGGTQWFKDLRTNSLSLVVCEKEGKVIGWGNLSNYRGGRPALQTTKEISFYVDEEHRRMGVASSIIEQLESIALESDIEHLVALLLDDNIGSRTLLEKHGYFVFGLLENAVKFPNVSKGHLFMGKHLV